MACLVHAFGFMRVFIAIALLSLLGCGGPEEPASSTQTGGVDGSAAQLTATLSSIRSRIFQPLCFQCHDSESAAAGVDLTSHSAILGEDHGHGIVVPGKPEESHLWDVLASGRMPPGGPKLAAPELEAVRKWIADGALDN